jgi:predicted GNAT superfamily acetyltransferase
MTLANYAIAVATPTDIAGIVALQDENQPEHGGILSVRFPRAWIEGAVADQSIIVARRNGAIAGYVISGELAAQTHVPVIQAMLRAYRPPAGTYMYGPVCIAQSERGKGIAGALFESLRARLPGRDSITFIRADNAVSRRAHAKMGMKEVAEFTHDGVEQIVVIYKGA